MSAKFVEAFQSRFDVHNFWKPFVLFAQVAAIMVFASGSVAAGEVELRIKGGGFSVTGELMGYDGKRYEIRSPALGQMALDATRFECVGPACPTSPITTASLAIAPFGSPGSVSEIAIHGSNTIGSKLMPDMIEAFAASKGLQATRVVKDDPLDLDFNLLDSSGRRRCNDCAAPAWLKHIVSRSGSQGRRHWNVIAANQGQRGYEAP